MTLLSIVAYYLFASYNKRLRYNRKQTKSMRFDKVVHILSAYRTILRNFAEHLSIFLLNTPQYFCRTLFSILTDNGLVLLQNIFPCFCRFISSMAENLSACFQNTVFLQNISQQFYRTQYFLELSSPNLQSTYIILRKTSKKYFFHSSQIYPKI